MIDASNRSSIDATSSCSPTQGAGSYRQPSADLWQGAHVLTCNCLAPSQVFCSHFIPTSPPPTCNTLLIALYFYDHNLYISITVMAARVMSGSWTSQQNGHFHSSNRTPSGSVSSRSQVGGFQSSSGGRGQSNKISLVHDSAIAIKRKSALELGSGVLQSVGETSFIKLVQWIRAERLSTLPHQGSKLSIEVEASGTPLTHKRHLGHRLDQSSLCR